MYSLLLDEIYMFILSIIECVKNMKKYLVSCERFSLDNLYKTTCLISFHFIMKII